MGFPCSGCGACCRRIDKVAKLMEKHPDPAMYFPHSWDETGVCEKLVGNLCSVYETRPLICNVDKMIEHLKMDKQQAYLDTAQACNSLMDEDQLPEEFRINLEWK